MGPCLSCCMSLHAIRCWEFEFIMCAWYYNRLSHACISWYAFLFLVALFHYMWYVCCKCILGGLGLYLVTSSSLMKQHAACILCNMRKRSGKGKETGLSNHSLKETCVLLCLCEQPIVLASETWANQDAEDYALRRLVLHLGAATLAACHHQISSERLRHRQHWSRDARQARQHWRHR